MKKMWNYINIYQVYFRKNITKQVHLTVVKILLIKRE